MRRNRFRPGDDAVSPVIGVVLLVGIAVLLTTSVGIFVLGFGPGATPPETEIQFYQESGNVTITVVQPAGVQAEELEIQVNGTETSCTKNDIDWPASGSLDQASQITVYGGGPSCPGGTTDLDPGTTVRVIWYAPGGGRSDILGEYEVI